MRIKRVLQGTALTALAAAAWMGAGTADASAAALTTEDVDFCFGCLDDDDNQLEGPHMHIRPDKDSKEIMVAVAASSKKGLKIADTAWDVYEVEVDDDDNAKSIVVDLSKLNNTKDNYVAIKADSSKPMYIRIRGSVKSQQIKYNPKTAGLDINVKKVTDGSNITKDNVDWEYRTSYGSWTYVPLTIFNDKNEEIANPDLFKEYQYQGATLYVRAAGKNTTVKDPNKEKDVAKLVAAGTIDIVGSTEKGDLYDAGWMPGKETKVNIAKMANGPKVNVDYVKGIVKVPAGTEYRLIASGSSIVTDKENPFDNASKSDKTVAELLKAANEGVTPATAATSGVIEVRKKATDKKSPSKWTRVDIEIPDAIVFDNKTVQNNKVKIATGGSVNIGDGITIAANVNKKKEYAGNVTIKAGDKYGITVEAGGKKVTIKAGKENKKVTVATGSKIKIAKAGDKKAKTWAGKETELQIDIAQ